MIANIYWINKTTSWGKFSKSISVQQQLHVDQYSRVQAVPTYNHTANILLIYQYGTSSVMYGCSGFYHMM